MSQFKIQHLLSLPTLIEIIILFILFLFSKIFTIILIISLLIAYFVNKAGTTPSNSSTRTMQSIIYYPDKSSQMHKITQSLPKIKPHQVLVSTKAVSINPVDYKLNICLFPFARWFISFTVGRDISGVVIEIGSLVTHFKEGDRIYGCAESGALAEYAVCNENKIAKIPNENIKYVEIVGVGLAGCTALQTILWFYTKEELQHKAVLVIGGSGGVGSQALQILKYYNTRLIWGVCSERNVDYVNTLCDKVINYSENVSSQINEQQFDLIIDTVTSYEDENQREKYSQYLSHEGKYVQINGKPFEFALGILASYLVKPQGIEPKNFHLHSFHYEKAHLEEIAKMVMNNKLKVSVECIRFNENEIVNAFNKLKSRRTVGKIIVDFEDNIQY